MNLVSHGVASCPVVTCSCAFLVYEYILRIVDVFVGTRLDAIDNLDKKDSALLNVPSFQRRMNREQQSLLVAPGLVVSRGEYIEYRLTIETHIR